LHHNIIRSSPGNKLLNLPFIYNISASAHGSPRED
jgi:hypothetical protein